MFGNHGKIGNPVQNHAVLEKGRGQDNQLKPNMEGLVVQGNRVKRKAATRESV